MTFLQSTRLWAPVASSSLPLAALGDSVLTVCIQMCLLTEYLAGSPEMISRFLAFKILYRLQIANRQANGDSAFQEANLSQKQFLCYIFLSNLLLLDVTVATGLSPDTSLGRVEQYTHFAFPEQQTQQGSC